MVEHRIRDPQAIEILESEVRGERPARSGGSCLICGDWIEDSVDDVYDVTIGRGGIPELVGICHAACMAAVVHPTVSLPA